MRGIGVGGRADLVGLLHLDRERLFGEQAAVARLVANGEDAAIDADVLSTNTLKIVRIVRRTGVLRCERT